MNRAYLLHSRPYRETSALVDIFTEESRCVRLVVKGLNRNGKSAQQLRGVLQPFTPMLCDWRGRTELKTLRLAEPSGRAYVYKDKVLYSAIYVNELLSKLLPKIEPGELLFQHYEKTLEALYSASGDDVAANADGQSILQVVSRILREFEFHLLDSLGYGIDFECEAATGEKISTQQYYSFERDLGFVPVVSKTDSTGERITAPRRSERIFSGDEIQAIAQRRWELSGSLPSAKKLSRLALDQLLGGAELDSRKLFR